MNALKSTPRHWTPVTDRDRALVREEVEDVIASPQFCNSKRYPALLRYVVEMTLEGRADQLKERALGIEVFHRPPDYDTNSDTVVRYTAGEVRKRLAAFYHERGDSAIQIALPSGSYVPEFFLAESDASSDEASALPQHDRAAGRAGTVPLIEEAPVYTAPAPFVHALPAVSAIRSEPGSRLIVRIVLGLVILCLIAGGIALGLKSHARQQTALQMFWDPLLHERGQTVLCVGGVTFADHNFSGTHTAGKDTPYPFASMQIVASVSQISGLLERGGGTYGVQAASSTQLSELREHPVVLIGGYNNEWTLRLTRTLRLHFTAEPSEAIADSERPELTWTRDRSQAYDSADDYALVARFRDNVTGSMVVVAAGLGRNGTELASQFLTSERYMELLRQRTGSRLGTANIEVLLQSRVIEGKTGAPQIEAMHVW